MQFFFVSVYRFFSKKKLLLWLFFAGSFVLWLFFAFRIRLQEDIAAMLPDSKAIRTMNDVVGKTQAGEQVIFMLSYRDSTKVDPDSLIYAANNLAQHLVSEAGEGIDTITLQAAGGYEAELTEIFSNNIPVFLTEKDYARMDTLLMPAVIDKTLESNRKILLSPASTIFKQFIAADPVGMSALVWQKLNSLQPDPGYETYDGYIFSKEQRQLNFFLKPRYKASETGVNADFFKKVDDVIARWGAATPGMKLVYFGGPVVAAGNAAQMRTDTILTLSVTVVLLLALTWYFFRRKRTPFLLMVPVLYGAATGMAGVYLLQGSISVIALGAGAIIMGIAIDFSIHFLAHLRHARNMEDTVRELSHPLTIGSFTTVAAFLSLRLVPTPALQDLGLFAAISLAGAALCTLIFLPHMPLGKHSGSFHVTVFDRVAQWQPERNKWLVGFIFLFTPVMLYFSKDVQFDSNLMHLNYLSPQLEKAQEEVTKSNAFALSSVFVVANGENDDIALGKLESVSASFDSLSDAGLVRSVSDPAFLLPSATEQRKRIARWQSYWTDERKAAVIQAVESASLKHGYAPGAFEGFKTTLTRNYGILDSSAVALFHSLYPGGFALAQNKHYAVASLKVAPEHRQAVFDVISKHQDVVVTDRQQGAAQLVEILNRDFTNIALYSSLIVFFALLISYGRIELAIIAFLPMAISWIWILGIMSLLGLKFNIVNVIISSLLFGLGDDYTIFTMDGLLERYKYGKQKLDSVRSAVYVSVVTVVIGLGVLLLAKHPALRSIAFISVTGLLCVLFISQTLQPFLFNWLIQHRADKGFFPFTARSFVVSLIAFAGFFIGSMLLTVLGVLLTKLWPFNKKKGLYYFHVCVSKATWCTMYIMLNIKKRIYKHETVDFNRPAIYIANHSSFLDTLLTTMLHPRMVLLTNKWVWRSPVFGAVVRMAEYYPVADGADESIAPLSDLVDRGYSIVIFPEGTRSYDDTIKRFHKGAFFIAEQLRLDIVPLIIHGASYAIQKGDWLLKNSICSLYLQERIKPDDTSFGGSYSERAKLIGRRFRADYAAIKQRIETPRYFKEQLIRSYTYKGPVLEWYCRVKSHLEHYYEPFHNLLPAEGDFYDLGCGYGFMSYMLHWAAPGRRFTGVDYDEDKINTAQHNFMRNESVRFEQGDLTKIQLNGCDGIIISDVLHYLLPEEQEALLERSYNALRSGGRLIVRDGVSEMKDRIKGTRLTELFSTKIFRFNKTKQELHYISRKSIETFATKHNMDLSVMDHAKFTANLVFVLRKP